MKLKYNVPLLYITASLMWGRFFIPILALFYIASQVPLEQFSIILSVFALSILILEIPSGVIADLLGKKKTLIISRAFYIAEIFLIAFYNGFWIFLIAKIISGIGVSLSSGTDSALLYDTLKVQDKERAYKRVAGNLFTVSNISKAFVFIVGAFLFTINYKLPAIVSLPFIILGFILTFFIKEPYVYETKFNLKNSIGHLKESVKFFWNSRYIKHIAFFSFLTTAPITIILSLSSAYFEEILIPIYLMGAIAFLSSMVTAYTSKKAHSLEEKLGQKKSLFLIQFLIIIGIFLVSLISPYLGLLFYFVIPFTAGFYQVIINDYIHCQIESDHRATLISIKNFFENLGIFLLFPLVGLLIKVKSMGFSLLIFGIIITIGYFLVYLYSRKVEKF